MSTAADASGGAAPADAARVAPLRALVLVVAGYVALTAWWLWPLPLRIADHAIYQGGTPFIAADVHLITWALAWDTHALLTHPLSLFDANVFHPAPLWNPLVALLIGAAVVFLHRGNIRRLLSGTESKFTFRTKL